MAILQFQNCEILASEIAAIQFNEAPTNDAPYESACDVTLIILHSGKHLEQFHESGKGGIAYKELASAWHGAIGFHPIQTPATPFTKIG